MKISKVSCDQCLYSKGNGTARGRRSSSNCHIRWSGYHGQARAGASPANPSIGRSHRNRSRHTSKQAGARCVNHYNFNRPMTFIRTNHVRANEVHIEYYGIPSFSRVEDFARAETKNQNHVVAEQETVMPHTTKPEGAIKTDATTVSSESTSRRRWYWIGAGIASLAIVVRVIIGSDSCTSHTKIKH